MRMNRIIYNSILVFSALLFASAIFCQEATSNRGLVLPASINLDSTVNTYAILIGITDYNYLQPLKYADNDALLLRELLKSRVGGHVPDSNIYLLLNEHATNARMLETIDRVKRKSKMGDKVIIYLGGHGAAHKSNYFFLSANCQPASSSNHYKTAGAIRMDDIKENIESWTQAAVRVILIVDACRTVLPGGIDGVNKVNILDEKAGDLMLLSASPNQVSIEDGSLGGGHGLFTYFLAKGMCGAAEGNNDGIIQFYELEEYVKKQVRERSKMVQIPSFCCSEQAVVPMSTVDTVFEQLIIRISALDDVNRSALSNTGLKNAQGFADTTGMKSFHQLLKAIEAFNFEGENGAEAILTSMEQKCPTCPVVLEAKRELAVAYLDFGQLLINRYLTGKDSRLFTRSLIDVERERVEVGTEIKYLLDSTNFEYRKLKKNINPSDLRNLKLKKTEKIKKLNELDLKRNKLNNLFEICQSYPVGGVNSKLERLQEKTYKDGYIWVQKALKWIDLDSVFRQDLHTRFNFLNLYGEQADLTYFKMDAQRIDSIIMEEQSLIALNLIGKMLVQAGDYNRAKFLYDKLISRSDSWAYPYNNVGELLEKVGDYQGAELQFKKATEADPLFTYAYNNLGLILTKQNKYSEARRVYLKAIEKDPKNVMTYNNLGKLYLIKGDTMIALQYFKKAVELNPKHDFSFGNICNLFLKQKDLEALNSFLSSMKLKSGELNQVISLDDIFQDEVYKKTVSVSKVKRVTKRKKALQQEIELVYIRKGTFTMGCTLEQQDCEKDETPHKVKLDGFFIGKYEVTQGLWKEVMGALPSVLHNCMECPIYEVSWEDVQHFIQKLNKMTGQKYRLPTEAEWEYAARGGGQGVMFGDGSNIADPDKINFDASKDFNKPYSLVGSFRGKTVPVGSLNAPNEFGIHDISGNVSEWCSDWYGAYPTEASSNPKGPQNGAFRVIRGGSWSYFAPNCRVAMRSNGVASKRYYDTGFRLAKSK
jgi:formylglycine-generating enzyme required for sulfatase activity/Tfp pilus assembly protein PilF